MLKKKLNASEDARIFRIPFCNPLKKNLVTMYKDNPSKPGRITFLLPFIIRKSGLNLMMRCMFFRCINESLLN